MTTFRLQQQTRRTSRFAEITIEVAASQSSDVHIAAAAGTEHRREAELGAYWALRHSPVTASVTVTGIVVTDADTGVGDVYEATARAVWQALHPERKIPDLSFNNPGMVMAWLTETIGRRLDAVTEARHWCQGRRETDAESLLHAWLVFEHAPSTHLRCHGDQLLLDKNEPYGSYDMGEYGHTSVGPAQAPDILATFIGARLNDGALIFGHDGGRVCVGLMLRFDSGDLVIGALGDEWVLAAGSIPAAAARYWTVQPLVRGHHP